MTAREPSGTPPIYLDYNASTPIDPVVAAAMRPFLGEAFGNPSSGHWASAPAKVALEKAHGQVAALLGCAPDEVVFTSGGSEANNLALKGVFFALRHKGEHLITTRVEHPAILGPCQFLERLGATVTYLPVDGTGRVNADAVRRAITPRTILIRACPQLSQAIAAARWIAARKFLEVLSYRVAMARNCLSQQ